MQNNQLNKNYNTNSNEQRQRCMPSFLMASGSVIRFSQVLQLKKACLSQIDDAFTPEDAASEYRPPILVINLLEATMKMQANSTHFQQTLAKSFSSASTSYSASTSSHYQDLKLGKLCRNRIEKQSRVKCFCVSKYIYNSDLTITTTTINQKFLSTNCNGTLAKRHT